MTGETRKRVSDNSLGTSHLGQTESEQLEGAPARVVGRFLHPWTRDMTQSKHVREPTSFLPSVSPESQQRWNPDKLGTI